MEGTRETRTKRIVHLKKVIAEGNKTLKYRRGKVVDVVNVNAIKAVPSTQMKHRMVQRANAVKRGSYWYSTSKARIYLREQEIAMTGHPAQRRASKHTLR